MNINKKFNEMTLKEFIRLVANGNGYTYVAIRRKDGFVNRTGEYWCDNVIGFSWCTRKGYKMGEDWNVGKCKVQSIETYTMRDGTIVPCAVID